MDPTRTLKGRSLEIWNWLYPTLNQKRRLLPEEHGALAQYCEAYESWEDAAKRVRDTTSVARSTRGKHTLIIVNPWVTVRDQAFNRMSQLAKQLGISPDSRIEGYLTIAEDVRRGGSLSW